MVQQAKQYQFDVACQVDENYRKEGIKERKGVLIYVS